jgi:uncharacterized protein YdeI (YjbR/CyaY-like superfamily)
LNDESDVLINAQEGTTKALRQWRMEAVKDIRVGLIRSYVKEAKAMMVAGREIKPERGKGVEVPAELTKGLRRVKGAKAAFDGLTPGRRHEYARYIAEAKRAETRVSRVEKVIPMIVAGVGLNDRYR